MLGDGNSQKNVPGKFLILRLQWNPRADTGAFSWGADHFQCSSQLQGPGTSPGGAPVLAGKKLAGRIGRALDTRRNLARNRRVQLRGDGLQLLCACDVPGVL